MKMNTYFLKANTTSRGFYLNFRGVTKRLKLSARQGKKPQIQYPKIEDTVSETF